MTAPDAVRPRRVRAGRDYRRLADVLRQAWEQSGQPKYAPYIDDRFEFMARVLIAVDDADHMHIARGEPGIPRPPRPPALKAIQLAEQFRPLVEVVAAAHGIPYGVLVGPRRDKPALAARFEAMWLIRNLRTPAPSYPLIAVALGRADHTSAIYGVRKFERQLAADPQLRARVLGEQQRGRSEAPSMGGQ